MRLLGIAGMTGLLSMTLAAPAQACAAPELWSTSLFTAQLSITAGDVNGDGEDDLVSFNLHGVGNRVMLSNGSAFEPEANWGNASFLETPKGAGANLVGDMDNDGRADSVVVRLPNPRGVHVARSETNQYGVDHFAAPTQWLNNYVVGDVDTVLADVDADGDMDVVGLYKDPTPVLVARSNGSASEALVTWGPPIQGEKTSLVADTTGDGAADYILVDTNGVRVVVADPKWWGAPQQWSTIPFYGTKKTLAADMDADGRADLVAIDDTGVRVMRSTGTGYAAPQTWYASPFYGTRETLAADVDGDGDADLVAVNSSEIWVLRS